MRTLKNSNATVFQASISNMGLILHTEIATLVPSSSKIVYPALEFSDAKNVDLLTCSAKIEAYVLMRFQTVHKLMK